MLHYRSKSILPTHRSDQDLAEKFSLYFSTKIKDIRAGLDSEVVPDADVIVDSSAGKDHVLDSFECASVEEVKRIITCSPSTSSSQDPVPTWVMKRHMDHLLPSKTTDQCQT